MQALFWNKVRNKKQILSFIHASHKYTDFSYTCTQVKPGRKRLRGTSGGEEKAQKWRRRDRLLIPSGDDDGDEYW